MGADTTLTSAMKSVGEAMAIGRTFKESFQKALRSLEVGAWGFGCGGKHGDVSFPDLTEIRSRLARPNPERPFFLRYAMLAGLTNEEIFGLSKIDPWFLQQLRQIVDLELAMRAAGSKLSDDLLRQAKEAGFADRQIAHATGLTPAQIYQHRQTAGVKTTFRLVDTCAAEFESFTPYFYSSYGDETEVRPSSKPKVMILGGGPNRIGQGIEFDYCCVHASYALRSAGYETVMVNYRVQNNRYIVDTVFDKAMLIVGVGRNQERVIITRRK